MIDRREPTALFERFAGCLLGGAVGDALGAAVEFHSQEEITEEFGTGGIRDFAPAYGRRGAITDDTQMTLFTAEGLIRAALQSSEGTPYDAIVLVHSAYLRWLTTQDERPPDPHQDHPSDGWLIGISSLHASRAPGFSCLSALQSGRMGSTAAPINDSKGCGGLMRAAPAGLMSAGNIELAFRLGCETAAITHGHPTGFLSAGAFAVVINRLVAGETLAAAIANGRERLLKESDSGETLSAIDTALVKADAAPLPIEEAGLGQGWVAEEALAISLYCALVEQELEEAVVRAVNHSGDSDSTGAITGNLLGAAQGIGGIPARWLEHLELRKEILRLAEDMTAVVSGRIESPPDGDWLRKYPPG